MAELTSQHLSHTELDSTKISLPALVKIANALHASVWDSKAHLMDDVQKVFADCDPDEVYVMPEAANAVKKPTRECES